MSDYYIEKQFIPLSDKNGSIVGSGERWDIHRRGLLHRGFTVSVVYDGNIFIQNRKHPVFDGVLDLTCSSHPLIRDGEMENEKLAVSRCLSRELNIVRSMYENIEKKGFVVYKAKDASGYIEHEYCTFYTVCINKEIQPNLEYAYGYEKIAIEQIAKLIRRSNIAPWIKEGINLL